MLVSAKAIGFKNTVLIALEIDAPVENNPS